MNGFGKMAFLIGLLIILFSPVYAAETVTNGAVTMFTIGDNILGILVHGEKKLLVYQINQRNIALKAVRTWHYDAQFANTIVTKQGDGAYPRTLDSQANPLRLYKTFFKKWEFPFDPKYKIKGIGEESRSSGGDLAIVLEESETTGLLVMLNSKNRALLVYKITLQSVEFLMCRTILMDVQIPLFYPSHTRNSPKEVRSLLKAIEKKLMPRRPGDLAPDAVRFKVEELEFIQELLEK